MKTAARKIAIVGAGWAGCAAAVELTRLGHRVTLFEASRTLGGRARRVEIDHKLLDNGQHILLGAYKETLRLMRIVGIDAEQALLRLPLQMRYPADSGGMDFITPHLPAPFHLLAALWRATGLTKDDKLALARFSTTARWMDWRLDTDCTVTELLTRFDQTERLTKLMWRPLCIAALNTSPETASAQVFLNALRDSLGARRAASDMLIPRVDLTSLFPQQAAAFIEQHGGVVDIGATVKSIEKNVNDWRLEISGAHYANNHSMTFDAVIVATQSDHVHGLIGHLIAPAKLPAYTYEPITTCYLQYSPELCLTQPFFALVDDATANKWGQFVFDRGQLDTKQAGLLAVVVSASHEAIAMGHTALIASVAAQLAEVFKRPELAQPVWTKVISEKRATFSCTPALSRPENATSINGLVIAGDYTASDYPATIESAVRSGVAAAKLLS
ncbi:MAG TPA: hydroxysqualene dehydroxylase HpnE [Burkholderiaceae bacterium]